MATTYLITGGGGNLARQLAPQLVAEGNKVVLFDLVEQPKATMINGCEYLHGNLTETKDIETALKLSRPTKLIHLASLLSGKCEQERALGWQRVSTAWR